MIFWLISISTKTCGLRSASDAVNRTQVKLVGLPHSEYPRLPEFIAYIKQEYETLAQGERNEPARQERLKLLHGIFKEMLANNGDIFDTITSDRLMTRIMISCIYDFQLYVRVVITSHGAIRKCIVLCGSISW